MHLVAKRTATTVPITPLPGKRALRKWLEKEGKLVNNWVTATKYRARSGTFCLVPARDGKLARVLVGVNPEEVTWQLARLPAALPKGRYYLDAEVGTADANALALGWELGTYRFHRYKPTKASFSQLVWPEAADRHWVTSMAEAIALGRDLITTPAEDMGPEQLGEATANLAKECKAKFKQIVGDDLLEHNFPTIHAVGRASSRAPRLLDLTWGSTKHPKVTLVGKGVCFDSGGLDIKPADNMKLMKKDMGGAAAVLSIASAVMKLGLPVRLRVLIPAVENSVSGNAFRPLDVLTTRKGITVEVGHTDAEGRLVLSDALTEADSEKPDLLIDVATLTGAARVALGLSLPALFSTDDEVAAQLLEAGKTLEDPLWQLPLHKPYRQSLNSQVAQINNVAGAFGGAITAALFLKEFVSKETRWMHIDTMGYNISSLPGRPMGGEVLGARAVVGLLQRLYAS
jgi:leucyl aminopeptidase